MGQLEMPAIDARMEAGVRGFLLGLIRGASWELTCGFCRQRFRRLQYSVRTSIDCPFCGTRNVLPSRDLWWR